MRAMLLTGRTLATWTVALATSLLGCGGPFPGDAPTPQRDAGDASSTPACPTIDGVRLCGRACTDGTACGGIGCQPLLDRLTGARLDLGVCVATLGRPIRTCGSCRDGQVCATIDGQGAICVDEAVCLSIVDLGFGVACRYADFAPYDGRPLAVAAPAACPDRACGPGCGSGVCDAANAFCSGRSADHGYGYCVSAALPTVACDPRGSTRNACAPGVCVAWTPAGPNDDRSLAYGHCERDDRLCNGADGRLTCSAR
jgi:hypothetical protein